MEKRIKFKFDDIEGLFDGYEGEGTIIETWRYGHTVRTDEGHLLYVHFEDVVNEI